MYSDHIFLYKNAPSVAKHSFMQKSLVPEKKTAELFFYTENVIAVQQLVSTLKF